MDDDDNDDNALPNSRLTEIEGEEDASDMVFNEGGNRIVPFNLTEENEEGHFDEAGNFVWRKTEDPEASSSEAWLENVSHEAMQAAARSKQQQELEDIDGVEESKGGDDGKNDNKKMTRAIALRNIKSILNEKERIPSALKRLSRGTKRKRPGSKKISENSSISDSELKRQKESFNLLTESVDFLMLQCGDASVYEKVREDFNIRERVVADTKKGAVTQQSTQWEYKGLDGKIHGPFDTAAFVAWKSQGYFTGSSAVMIRKIPCIHHRSNATESNNSKSAEEELMADFDNEEDEENEWISTDDIDFSKID